MDVQWLRLFAADHAARKRRDDWNGFKGRAGIVTIYTAAGAEEIGMKYLFWQWLSSGFATTAIDLCSNRRPNRLGWWHHQGSSQLSV